MSSPAYRTCVARLERLLSPRVTSRTLRMGMQQAAVTAETATAADLDPVLKGPVFKQLQVALPPAQAREAVEEILGAMRQAEEAPDTAPGTPAAEDAVPPGKEAASLPDGGGDAAPDGDRSGGGDARTRAHDRLEALRTEMRPYNLYFEWPEVRRLRAQLQRLQDDIEAGGDGSGLADEADAQLAVVASKLEDMLVLQARDLAELEEVLEEVQVLGGVKVRRLDALVKHVRDAQASRQLVEAEIERGRKLARDLRKLMASSVFQDASTPSEGPSELESRLRALDLEAEGQDLGRLARAHGVLLEHHDALAARVAAARERLAAGEPLGAELTRLQDDLPRAEGARRREVGEELDAAATAVAGLPDAAVGELPHELEVLRAVLESGLPPLADLVRFRELLGLAGERAAQADRHAEADAAATRARLDAQGERLARARHDLLRYRDETRDAAVGRLREAVERLHRAQVEERLDAEAEADLVDATAALAVDGDGSAPAARIAQVRALLDRLDGLPLQVDPAASQDLRHDLEAWLDAPPDASVLAWGAAAVADAVAGALNEARARLERYGAEATRWGLHDVLWAVRDANERLEDGADPELDALERRLEDAREAARVDQLERLHQLERDAERLQGAGDENEAALAEALALARGQIAAGEPARALDQVQERVAALEATLARLIADVMPRLDAALATFRTVERLNSDEVATVRRILSHLDTQREAFARISPGMRARLERSLREAEGLLTRLEEEERATRAIADQLIAGDIDDLFGLFGGGGTPSPAPSDPAAGTEATAAASAATTADADAGSDADADAGEPEGRRHHDGG